MKKILAVLFLLAALNSPIVAKSSKKDTNLNKGVYLHIKNDSTRLLLIKEGVLLKTHKILKPGEEFLQYQVNSTISNLQIFYKKDNFFVKIPDNYCQNKFFLATYEASVKENEDNIPDEEDGHINLNIPPFCQLSKETQKYYNLNSSDS